MIHDNATFAAEEIMELAMVTPKRPLLISLRLLKAKEATEQAVKSIMPSLTGSETLPAPYHEDNRVRRRTVTSLLEKEEMR